MGKRMGETSCARPYDKEKLKQVIHYMVAQCCHLESFGKTVLFKLLYFADFDYYELTEEKLTRESYRRLDLGPAPCHFEQAINELVDEAKIVKQKGRLGKYDQQRFLSQKNPDLSLLNARELQTVERVLKRYSGMNASQISALSHMDLPYKATKDRKIIDYELVFYRDSALSVREYNDD
jgi:uncharacterized phage-associated protein